MSQADKIVGREAVEAKGWWRAHRWLVLRRLSQLGIIGLFLLGPLAGVWIVKGNLSSSLTLGVLPLTDPFTLAQVIAARHWPELSALAGAAMDTRMLMRSLLSSSTTKRSLPPPAGVAPPWV